MIRAPIIALMLLTLSGVAASKDLAERPVSGSQQKRTQIQPYGACREVPKGEFGVELWAKVGDGMKG